ncbi:MAG: type I 3-dehydroquinate dehydratase [Clostridia bacterium]|nr:type I 3-dehydroquinate dehydratase [Clostridia bacterium]
MKPTFLQYDKPLLCAMIQCRTPEECIDKIRLSISEGAEALGIQLCKIKREYRTPEILKEIFAACKGRPIYVTSYRHGESTGMSDEECAELLLMALDCGATLIDVFGDMFEKGAKYQLATDNAAVEKQKVLIAEIHRRGGEVLMSCHTKSSLTVEENIELARAQVERGADVIKIVDECSDKGEIPSYIESIQRITAMTDKKLLFLVSGEGRIIRYIGANFGVCMYLCVAYHGEIDTPAQPLLSKLKVMRDNILFDN